MSPWVRLQENAIDHPKLLGLVDLRRPFDLWIWGLAYAQKHLTDGLIPLAALPKGTDKAAQILVARQLWNVSEIGYTVHDYLDWNDSRDTVISKRSGAKSRAKKSRDSRDHRAPHDAVGRGSNSLSSSEGVQGKPKPSYDIAPDLAARAGRFVERFEELFQTHRHGARYFRRQPALDFDRALSLCGTWDDARLEKLVVVFMKSDDEWIEKTDRGMAAFAAKATWCDERLAAWEADQKRQGRAS